jgi:hypothetical protein
LSYSPQNPTPNDTVYFTAVASDPDGDALTYKWFLDGVEQTNATAPDVRWANPPEGTYTVRVVVSDGKGGMAEDSIEFTVQAAHPRYVIMKGTGDLQGEEPLAFVEKIEVDGKITESRTPLYKDAYVKTGPGVEIVIRFASGVVTRVKENTHYEIEEVKFSGTPQAVIYTRLKEGLMDFWFKGRELEQKFEIEANRVVVGIKGTEGTIKLISGITTVTVTEGEVEVRDKATGAVSTVRAGETVSFGGTPPPSGEKSIAEALDANGNGTLEDSEILMAIQYWISSEPVPGTGGKMISDAEMLRLIELWISGGSVRGASVPQLVQPLRVDSIVTRSGGLATTIEVQGSGIAGLELEVFDLAGRRVFSQRAAGNRLVFQGLDNAGRALANGVYLYVVTARGYAGQAQRSEVRKLVVLR